MGGKKKQQAQRTKNNAKPSNSGRTAELMAAHLGNIKGFGEPAFPANFGPISNLSLDFLDPSVDPNFQVVLKKMSKKDSVTRYKALNEFVNLCKESDDDAVKSALSTWVRLYSNLALDTEHRIREAAQHAHHAIVSKVGRNLAPYIKQIAPYWFISQYDTYAPAASAASNSFKAAFPPHKLHDVIVFCQVEILQFISDNILTQTPESTSRTENTSKENLEAKYEQVLISSLNGYALYISKISEEQLEKVEDINTNIITSPKFWKFPKYKNGAIRAAWFSLLSSILQFAPNLIKNEHKRLSNAVLGHISDYDPIVLPKVWEATLLVVSRIQDCWQHVNIDKLFMPKFSHILAQGGQGNATVIYPNIILLLNYIPESVVKDKMTFFGKIFSSFQKGMKKPCVTQSQSESKAVARSFLECIQYLIRTYPDDTEFCNSLIEQHVLEVISNTMLDSIHRHLMTPLYISLPQMLLNWQNNETTNVNYKKYTEKFWIGLISICKCNIKKCLLSKDILAYLFESNVKMIDYLNIKNCTKKDDQVKFAGDNNEPKQINKLYDNFLSQVCEMHLQNVIVASKELTHEYFIVASNSELSYDIKNLAIKQLWKIIVSFKKEAIIKLMEGYENDLCEGLSQWIKDVNISTDSFVGLIFATVDNIKNDELKEKILMEFTNVRSKNAILESAKLANDYVNGALKNWMKSSLVKDELSTLLKTLNDEDISIDVLIQCLRSDVSKGSIIGEETVLSLLSVLIEQLKSGITSNNKNLSTILDSFFSNNSPNCLLIYKNSLLELLHLCFQNIIIGKNWECLFPAWRKGLALLNTILEPDDPLFLEHIKLCADFVAKYINEESVTKELNLSLIIKVCIYFISTISQQNAEKKTNSGINISKLFLNSVINSSLSMYQQKIEDMCFYAEVIYGHLYNNDIKENQMNRYPSVKWDPLKERNFSPYIRSLMFCVKYALRLIDDDVHIENDSESEDGSLTDCTVPSFSVIEMNDLIPLSVKLCHGFTLIKTVKLYYNETKQCSVIADYIDSLGYLLKELVHRLAPVQQLEVLSLTKQNSETLGKQWSQTYKTISVDFLDQEMQHSSKLLNNDIVLVNEGLLNIDYIRALRSDMLNNFIQEFEVLNFFENLVDSYKMYNKNWEITDDLNDRNLNLESELIRVLTTFIDKYPSEINKSKKGLDFIIKRSVIWIKSSDSVKETCHYYKEIVGIVVAACELGIHFALYLECQETLPSVITGVKEEFLMELFCSVEMSWKTMANYLLDFINLDYIGLLHLKELSNTLCRLGQIGHIRSILQKSDKNYDCTLLAHNYITSPYIPVQIAAYNTILIYVPTMVKLDEERDENELEKLTCDDNIKSNFIHTQNIVTAMLHEFSLGVSCSVAPFTDSYTYTLGYVLLWSFIFEMCKQGNSQVRYLYTLWIKEMDLIVHIMESLLKLMPDSVLHFVESNIKKRQKIFTEKPSLSFDGWDSQRLSNYCCWLFCDLLRTLPAVARQWAAEADPKLLSYADKITTSYVSSALCAEEMKAIMNQQKGFDNMKVSTHPSVREVVAVYTVEESSTELIITLANNHPLTPPKVEIPKAMISSNQTRQWLMQLTIFLTHQNGSIWDGLLLWKSNLDKKFEGIEECYICFSILHNTSHQLPKLSCQTCKKKFHSFCLYKWFTTSNKSTCPICRNHF